MKSNEQQQKQDIQENKNGISYKQLNRLRDHFKRTALKLGDLKSAGGWLKRKSKILKKNASNDVYSLLADDLYTIGEWMENTEYALQQEYDAIHKSMIGMSNAK